MWLDFENIITSLHHQQIKKLPKKKERRTWKENRTKNKKKWMAILTQQQPHNVNIFSHPNQTKKKKKKNQTCKSRMKFECFLFCFVHFNFRIHRKNIRSRNYGHPFLLRFFCCFVLYFHIIFRHWTMVEFSVVVVQIHKTHTSWVIGFCLPVSSEKHWKQYYRYHFFFFDRKWWSWWEYALKTW